MNDFPYRDPRLDVEKRVDDLLSRLTLSEKVGQLNQVPAIDTDFDRICELASAGKVGSLVLAWTPWAGVGHKEHLNIDGNNRAQRAAVERSRLGIPLIMGRDVVHGYRTIFPIPLGQAAAWDPGLVEEAARVAAREAASAGIHWTFAPVVDIARDPRWGRVAEGFGEDPYLCGVLARASVRGYQGDDPSDPEHIAACLKHFIGYGAVEGGRDYATVEVSDNTLRNVHLPPFRAGIEAGALTVMSAFHEIDGQPCSGSRYLLTDILRADLGFEGFVVSDWASVDELQTHGVAASPRDAAQMAFNAGVDMEMSTHCFVDHVAALVESGLIAEERLDDAVRRILRVKFRLGLFERPYADPDLSHKVVLAPDHLACARALAARSIVLLKNERRTLPIRRSVKKIALLGPLKEAQRELMGTWATDAFGEDTVSILDGIRNAAPDAVILTGGASADIDLIQASEADVVVVALGEHHMRSGENASLATLELPAGQLELVRAVRSLGKPVVIVVCAGRPLILTDIEPLADAMLYAWHPGIEAGNAIADVLFGAVNPSGKLPITFPRHVGQVPIYYGRKNTGRPADGGYKETPTTPLYCFGYGLSYTTFEFSDLRIDGVAEGIVIASAMITNVGQVDGEHVAQCYIQDVVASVARPIRELKGFQRVRLAPGESTRVEFRLGPDELSFAGRDGARRVEPGDFNVWIGSDSDLDPATAVRGSFALDSGCIIKVTPIGV
jgi:beta-glucosidase